MMHPLRLRDTPGSLPSILIYSAPFHPAVGGMERFAEELASGLAELGYPVEVATRTPAAPGDATTFPFAVTRVSGKLQLARAMLRHRRVLFVGLTFYDVLLASALRRRIVLTHHGPYVVHGGTRAWAGAIKRWLSRFYHGICVSHYLAGWLPGPPLVIHNGYRDELFAAPAPAGARLAGSFIFVGRLVSEKGVDVLVRSFARLHAQHPHARLTIVGEGPEREALARLAAALGCADAVHFAGSQGAASVAAMLRRHRCLVAPSLGYESFGIVALEGLAAGCEVIVSRRGGLPEAVGDFGWVVEPELASLHAAMDAVLGGASRRDDTGTRQFLREHERKAVAQRYAEAIARFTQHPREPLASVPFGTEQQGSETGR
ncbi:glycosyltransferase family 4 protein [Cupriavidus necator]|uniref:glycosyltransferase family 4 protein n=1 Tax=Cupriavidus necator TaxID=106590 RepID=UPI00278AFA61|nr:glycosyltransferase family 4 protein [Cupriavidus necator]MDQ0143536.1 glycosyltransferase involved in cell wall biosynthesis [Cupriavidus necator]